MSELRDLTQALRAVNNRITGIEECLVLLIRDSQQQTQWRHEQRNQAQIDQLNKEQTQIAVKQVQEACGAISHKLSDLNTQLGNLSIIRNEDIREVKRRLHKLETGEEVTKA